MTAEAAKPFKLAVWKFASCDGCQLSLLNLEEEFLALGDVLDIAHFPEFSRRATPGPYDVSLVEGSITNAADADRIQQIRRDSKWLITIGACATNGGIQALRNFASIDDYNALVYPHPEFIDSLAQSTPIAEHVRVDYELHGCPVNKQQLLEVILAYLDERRPQIANTSVCEECKADGNVCIMVANGIPCLGPITRSGCGALCPSYQRGCYGCFGPKENANVESFRQYLSPSLPKSELVRLLRNFNAWAPAFKDASIKHENENH